jgi:hypothetical protein
LKGITEIGAVIGVAIVIGSTIIVMNALGPVVDEGKKTETFIESKSTLALIDRSIQQLMLEAVGARRQLDIDVKTGTLIISGNEEKVKIRLEGYNLLQPGTSVQEGNIHIQSGGGVDAYEADINGDGETDLVLKNNALTFAIKKIGNETNSSEINTSTMITYILNNRTNTVIRPGSGVFINDIQNSDRGLGFTSLSRLGTNLGESSILVTMRSYANIDYEALFTLLPGADFITVEVKNINFRQ